MSVIAVLRPQVIGGGGGGGGAAGQVLFNADLTNPDALGANRYNFAGVFAPGTSWSLTHLAGGGRNGRNAARIVWNDAQQYSYGWWTGPLGYTFGATESIFMRGSMRYINAHRWADSLTNHKIVIFGNGTSRCIFYGNRRSDSVGGALGWINYGGTNTFFPFAIPSYFGLSGIANDWGDAGGVYGSLKIGKNISLDCAGPALVTHGNRANPPAPGPNSAAPVGGWYDWQFEVVPGNSATHNFKLWVNNNDYNNPTVVLAAANRSEVVDTTDWGLGANFGSYIDNGTATGNGYEFERYQIATGFDPNWAI